MNNNISGESGIKIGIAGSGEPVLEDFGDLYANFMYSGNGGTMEVSGHDCLYVNLPLSGLIQYTTS